MTRNKLHLSAALVSGIVALFGPRIALGQSSGSFNYNGDYQACTDIGGLLGGGTTRTALSTTLKVSSGNGNVLIVRPSAVVGLLTDVSLQSKNQQSSGWTTSSSQAYVNFAVSVTPLSGQPVPTVTPSAPVTYSDRYIQISTNLFSVLSACTTPTNVGTTNCQFDLNETTLSSHSFDWVVSNLQSGNYQLTVTWTPTTLATAPAQALACVGPVVITAEQAKIFNQSTSISPF